MGPVEKQVDMLLARTAPAMMKGGPLPTLENLQTYVMQLERRIKGLEDIVRFLSQQLDAPTA